MELVTSTPSLTEFDPKAVPYQYDVIKLVRKDWDYNKSLLEVMLSGSVGSAKSILMAHLAVTHCLMFRNAKVLMGRQTLPDLKGTIFSKIIEHLQDEKLKEGIDYKINYTSAKIKFLKTGSLIEALTWGDKKYKKFRSYDYSAAIIEEITENTSEEFDGFYKEMKARIGRLLHIPEKFIICATNPDAPSHSAYDYFIGNPKPNRKVFYSVTTDNPFLPKDYIETLLETFTEREARRMIYGEWLELKTEVVYYAYDAKKSRISSYRVDPNYNIYLTYDFNIGLGKPMSCCMFQYIGNKFYFFAEVSIQGANTQNTLDEWSARGFIKSGFKYVINGDASGANSDTRFNKSDYDIIKKHFENYIDPETHEPIQFEIDIPLSNPPIRKRHIYVNGQMYNAKKECKVFVVHPACEMVDKGFRLTKLKKGGQYIEDDKNEWQHMSNAATYGIFRQIQNIGIDKRFLKRKII